MKNGSVKMDHFWPNFAKIYHQVKNLHEYAQNAQDCIVDVLEAISTQNCPKVTHSRWQSYVYSGRAVKILLSPGNFP